MSDRKIQKPVNKMQTNIYHLEARTTGKYKCITLHRSYLCVGYFSLNELIICFSTAWSVSVTRSANVLFVCKDLSLKKASRTT